MSAPDPLRMVDAPMAAQRRFIIEAALADPVCAAILERAGGLNLPGWRLCAGAVYQNVWNALTGRAPGHGVADYDIAYFDPSDLSYEAEDAVIRRCAAAFADIDAEIEVRNQARIHLWFNAKFGAHRPAFTCTEDGINAYAADAHKLGLRRTADGSLDLYAPAGFSDVLAMRVAPCADAVDLDGFARKAARWKRSWPELAVRLTPIRPG